MRFTKDNSNWILLIRATIARQFSTRSKRVPQINPDTGRQDDAIPSLLVTGQSGEDGVQATKLERIGNLQTINPTRKAFRAGFQIR